MITDSFRNIRCHPAALRARAPASRRGNNQAHRYGTGFWLARASFLMPDTLLANWDESFYPAMLQCS